MALEERGGATPRWHSAEAGDSFRLRAAKCQVVAGSKGCSGCAMRPHQPAVPRGIAESSGSHLLLCLQPVPCRNSSCSWTEASSYRAGWAFWIHLSNHAVHLLGLWASSQDWILREVLPFCFHVHCFAANSALATSRPLKNHLSLTMALAETSHSPLFPFW